MDEQTLQRSLRARPPADPAYHPRLDTRVATAVQHMTRRSYALAPMAALLLAALLLTAGAIVGSQLLRSSPTPLIPPDRGVFTPTRSMAEGRGDATATLLRDGRVLVIGGYKHFDGYRDLAEIWDPATGAFSPAGSLALPREGHAATLLRDGRVLVVGGYGPGGYGPGGMMASAEIWDPAAMSFSPTGSLAGPRALAQARLLPDGRVLVNNGYGDFEGGMLTSAEVWDPDTGAFSPADTLPEARYPTGTLLEDGRILVIDGDYFHAGTGAVSVWDPATGSSRPVGTPTPARKPGVSATRLLDGRILVAGGGPIGTTTEIWDPTTGSFSRTGSLGVPRYLQTATLLLDGRVLVAGDDNANGASTELFELR